MISEMTTTTLKWASWDRCSSGVSDIWALPVQQHLDSTYTFRLRHYLYTSRQGKTYPSNIVILCTETIKEWKRTWCERRVDSANHSRSQNNDNVHSRWVLFMHIQGVCFSSWGWNWVCWHFYGCSVCVKHDCYELMRMCLSLQIWFKWNEAFAIQRIAQQGSSNIYLFEMRCG